MIDRKCFRCRRGYGRVSVSVLVLFLGLTFIMMVVEKSCEPFEMDRDCQYRSSRFSIPNTCCGCLLLTSLCLAKVMIFHDEVAREAIMRLSCSSESRGE